SVVLNGRDEQELGNAIEAQVALVLKKIEWSEEQFNKIQKETELDSDLQLLQKFIKEDALVNVEDGWVQAFSSIKIEDGREESLIGNSCIESGPGHQQYQGSGESEIVRCKKRTKADSSAHGDEDTSGVSGIAKKSKKDKTETGNSE
ncbi:hypothetical protein CBL_03854, partial [Carabus blaptoides fortunei]